MLDAPIEDIDGGSAAPVVVSSPLVEECPATPTNFEMPSFPDDSGCVGLSGFPGVHTNDDFEHLESDLQEQFLTDGLHFDNMSHGDPACDFFGCSGDGSFAQSLSSAFGDGGFGFQGSSSLASSAFIPVSEQPVVTFQFMMLCLRGAF